MLAAESGATVVEATADEAAEVADSVGVGVADKCSEVPVVSLKEVEANDDVFSRHDAFTDDTEA